MCRYEVYKDEPGMGERLILISNRLKTVMRFIRTYDSDGTVPIRVWDSRKSENVDWQEIEHVANCLEKWDENPEKPNWIKEGF